MFTSDAASQVKELVLAYADALNLNDLEAFGEAFAVEGVWDVTPYFKGEGRANVVSVFAKQRAAFGWVYQVVHQTRVLSVDGNQARARSYVAEYGARDGVGYYMLGVYHDQCAVQDGRWRFAHRRFDVLYLGPPDLSVPPRNYPAPKHF